MREYSVMQRLFGITQVILLLAIVVAIFIYRRRQKQREKAFEVRLDNVDLRSAIRRTPVAPQPRAADRSVDAENSGKDSKPHPSALGSAFPSWDKTTPPHEILGVHPRSDATHIEAAYKALLKRYHPDRYAHWGPGYQTRAHHVVLLLQDARDRMLGKKS